MAGWEREEASQLPGPSRPGGPVVWMPVGRGIIKGTSKRFNRPGRRENESSLPVATSRILLRWDPDAQRKAPEELTALVWDSVPRGGVSEGTEARGEWLECK